MTFPVHHGGVPTTSKENDPVSTRVQRLTRDAESAKATALAYGALLSAARQLARNAAPRTVAADVYAQEVTRLEGLVDEMRRAAIEWFGEAAKAADEAM